MSKNTTQDEKDTGERIAQLEARVAALEEQLDGQPTGGKSGGLDRYDATVLNAIEERFDRTPSPRAIVALYQEAGMRDLNKIKERHKFLAKTGRIEKAVETEGE